jgi:phosphatidylglycerophosphatase A
VGYAPKAPGTFGSVLGLAIFLLYFRLSFASLGSLMGLIVLLTLLGVGVAERAGRIFQREDDGRIVIDEVVGQLLTLVPLALFPVALAEGGPKIFFWVVTGFVLFRLFDIWKPGPVRWAERNLSGGSGVMMDDVVAGGIGALLLAALL